MSEAPRQTASAAPDPQQGAQPALPAPFGWSRRGGLSWIEASLPGTRAVFSTRLGGSSEGPYSSLNLGILTEDDPRLVARNREALAAAVGRDPRGVAIGRQVHAAGVESHSGAPDPASWIERGPRPVEADVQATGSHDVTPAVLVADCVPLVVSAPAAVAVAHCGRRGVLAGVVGQAVAAVCELAGAGPHGVSAALGPAIGSCCYEVGDEVREAFAAAGHREDAFVGPSLDLPRVVRSELRRAGVAAECVRDVAICSSCRADLFFSHRRDGGLTGRQVGMAWRES